MANTNMLELIEAAMRATDYVVANSKFYTEKSSIIENTRRILILLRNEFNSNPNQINERVLRASVDLGISAYRVFENTPLENAIHDITSVLYKTVPNYKDLMQLGLDFGKGDPI